MEKEERDILVCMSEELLDPVHIAHTVAAITNASCSVGYAVMIYMMLLRMEVNGLVEVPNVMRRVTTPKFRLTEKGFFEKTKFLAEDSSIESTVLAAYAKVEDILINSAPHG